MRMINPEADASEAVIEGTLFDCLDLDKPKSFFLYAGAGSGKTRTLVEVMKKFRYEHSDRLRLSGQRVAIITYTNAACDEIKRRLQYESTVVVSTIHSFAWELIKGFQKDIKEWLRNQLQQDIAELEIAQSKGRPGTKIYADRPRQIETKRNRLEQMNQVKKFIYNPSGENTTKNSLNHSDVLKMTYEFIHSRPLMQKILVREFPILLIDESQDTKRELMEVLFEVQEKHGSAFTLGLFGDTMQRIYADGKVDLATSIPESWLKPEKKGNYRSQSRIVALVNDIRKEVDDHVQTAYRTDGLGTVRLFIKDTNGPVNKQEFEQQVCASMAAYTGDTDWTNGLVKTLTLEHHMAAIRGGFERFFGPLYAMDRFKTGLLDGTLSGISLLMNQVAALVKAREGQNEFLVAKVVKAYSPLLGKATLDSSKRPSDELAKARDATKALTALWDNANNPALIDVLKEVYRSGIFEIPDSLLPIVSRSGEFNPVADEDSLEPIDRDAEIDAWDEALQSSFAEFEAYANYIADKSRFGTHQGVKGLEFPRVMVVLDDEEARGFMFKYDRLFGVEAQSSTDRSNEASGKETTTDRTRRLFYVTCSRAEESLAVIAYTRVPDQVRQHVVAQGWFTEDEIL